MRIVALTEDEVSAIVTMMEDCQEEEAISVQEKLLEAEYVEEGAESEGGSHD